MAKIELPLSQFTYAEKLDLLETIWDDLSRDDAAFESPAWHENILNERREAFSVGAVQHSDWAEAKARIKRNLSCHLGACRIIQQDEIVKTAA
jgi:Putative addiction module component